MSVFSKAADKKKQAKKTTTKEKKQTVWLAGDPDSDKIAKAVHNVVELKAQAKAIEAKMSVHKTLLKTFAQERYFEDYASTGIAPETPMKVQNSDGEAVTFVVQERNQYGVKDESRDALVQLLGEDGADELIYEEIIFGFDRGILAKDGVMDILGKHIEAAMAELVESGTLNEDEAENLIDADERRSFIPGILQRLGLVAGKNASKMRQICEAMGSSCVRYIKA
jgi:hypothetical protein